MNLPICFADDPAEASAMPSLRYVSAPGAEQRVAVPNPVFPASIYMRATF